MKITRVLVTGAAGFIAPVVRTVLHRRGITSIGLDREPHLRFAVGSAGRALPRVDLVADLVDTDLESLIADVDAVIHLAGTPGVQTSWDGGFETHVRNNLVATQRLCEAALQVGLQRLVVASSSSVYGNVANGDVAETDPLHPLSPYGASKAAMEHLVGVYAARGLSVTPLRFFTVYGPGQRPDMAFHRLFQAALGGPAFPLRHDGSQQRSFTYIDDIAEATARVALTELEPGLPLNLGGTETLALSDVISRIEALSGRSIPIDQRDAAPGDPSRTAADIERARSLLGWEPTTKIDEGLSQQWHWHQAIANRLAA